MYVLAHLETETLRFNEIRRRIDGLSQRVLTATLRSLERDGHIIRTQYPTIPPQVDYRLTPLGRSLLGAVRHVVGWSGDHHAQIQANRAAFDGRDPSTPPRPRTATARWPVIPSPNRGGGLP